MSPEGAAPSDQSPARKETSLLTQISSFADLKKFGPALSLKVRSKHNEALATPSLNGPWTNVN